VEARLSLETERMTRHIRRSFRLATKRNSGFFSPSGAQGPTLQRNSHDLSARPDFAELLNTGCSGKQVMGKSKKACVRAQHLSFLPKILCHPGQCAVRLYTFLSRHTTFSTIPFDTI
jgi:hypothetical protein